MESANLKSENPEFLLKSTFNVALLSTVSVIPFAIYCIVVSKTLLGLIASLAAFVCLYNVHICHKGIYKQNLNLFGMLPVLSASAFLGMYEWGVVGSFWSYPMVLVCYFVLPMRIARPANIFLVLLMLPLAWNHLEPDAFARFYTVLIGISIFAHFTLKEINRQHYELHRQSVTDALTGLYNRLLLGDALQHAIDLHQREKTPMSILMLDLDHFKQVNDKFGHETGDKVLKGLANIMKNSLRKTDSSFRLGGEEFLVILRGANLHAACELAEKIRISILTSQLIPNYEITASLGVSELSSDHTHNWNEWVSDCDKNLYAAKRNGRNTIVAN